MGGHYDKGLYNQLMDVMSRLEKMEAQHKQDRKEIAALTTEVKSLRKENAHLRGELERVKAENTILRAENEALRKENQLLREDNERMKRILNNDSSNSSLPPSADQPGRAANTYNGRKPSQKKPGAQPGHPGHHTTKAEVEEKIRAGIYEHRVEEIGVSGRRYVTRYRLDLEVKVIATEVRIYANEEGKIEIPEEYKAEVTYGNTVKAIAGYLYSEGVVANDRICAFINSLSGDSLHISEGSIYGFCNEFAQACAEIRPKIEQRILDTQKVCTDATTVTTDGTQTYIRNFSTPECVLYCSAEKKNLETLNEFSVLKGYAGTLIHDHETALYHFGVEHGECNVHLSRYLLKNTEETKNEWSHDLDEFLQGMNCARKAQMEKGVHHFTAEQLERYEARYDTLVAQGREENRNTQGKVAKKEENALLNRLEKYKSNHLLFLHDFDVPFSNNMSERDLRPCKNRQKMAGGFRTEQGRQMYCDIMSFVQTVKRTGMNILRGISSLLQGTPVIQ